MNAPISDNHDSSKPDELDALFSAARTSEPYLRDDGFSDNVVAKLPAQPGNRLSNGKKNGIILGSAVLGSGCAAALLSSFAAPINQWLAQMSGITVGLPALAAIAGGLLVVAGAVIWANYREWI